MTIAEIQELIKKDETRTLELKKTTGELKEAMHTICAFLNTAGGQLLFGIAPGSLQVIGQQVTDNTRREIARELTKIEPAVSLDVNYIELDENADFYVIVIDIPTEPDRNRPYVYDGRPYYRIESTTSLMPQSMYQELLLQRDIRKRKWEEEIDTKVSVDSLDEESVRRLVSSGIQAGRIPESMRIKSIPEILDKMKLSENGHIKNAAVALFTKEDYAPIQLHIRLARFKGTNKREFIDNRRSIGNIFHLYDDGMAFLFKHLNISGTFVDGQPERVESLTIPYKALRECLLNALAHRLYDSPSGFVSIAIYDDRVEIENLGTLPAGFTLDDMMKPHISHAQNPLIAQIMYYGKYLETWGRGIELMNDECTLAGVPRPEFEMSGGCFKATFRRHDYVADVSVGGQQDSSRTQVGPKWDSSRTQVGAKHTPSSSLIAELVTIMPTGYCSVSQLMEICGKRNRKKFRENYMLPALQNGMIERKYPETPNHPHQQYRLSERAIEWKNRPQ